METFLTFWEHCYKSKNIANKENEFIALKLPLYYVQIFMLSTLLIRYETDCIVFIYFRPLSNACVISRMCFPSQVYEMLKGSLNKVVLYLERCVVGSDVPPLDTVGYSFFKTVQPMSNVLYDYNAWYEYKQLMLFKAP